jgi:hypothetical protein
MNGEVKLCRTINKSIWEIICNEELNVCKACMFATRPAAFPTREGKIRVGCSTEGYKSNYISSQCFGTSKIFVFRNIEISRPSLSLSCDPKIF